MVIRKEPSLPVVMPKNNYEGKKIFFGFSVSMTGYLMGNRESPSNKHIK